MKKFIMKKTQQPSRKQIMPSSIDRLSAFPDDVLCHILSFLPTKISVSTSILARRWRFLWAHVPNLHLVHDREELKIETIYNKILLLYKVKNMNAFCLSSDDTKRSGSHLEACIEDVINRNVKELDLSFVILNCFPSCIFTCRTVVDMKLSGCGYIPMTDDICLPALKKLCLSWVRYGSDESLPFLLSRCPVLEELTVHRLSADVACLIVSSRTIHKLVLNSSFVDHCDTNDGYTVKIDAPEVRYLKVRDFVSKEVSAGSLASLIEADVNLDKYVLLNGIEDEYDDSDDESDGDAPVEGDDDDVSDEDALNNEAPMEEDDLYARSVLEFVGCLSNVKYLKLSTGLIDVSDSEFSTWTVKYNNLIKLELRGDWRFIPNFLENADNLEALIICTDNVNLKYWIEPKEVPSCLLSHLGIVRIDYFECEDQEFHMIKYILRNGKVLKRMEIYSKCYGIDLEKKSEALKRISLFPRGSVECELAFH